MKIPSLRLPLLGLFGGGIAVPTFRLLCKDCSKPSDLPMTSKGYCVHCAADLCADGAGDEVGLPTTDDTQVGVDMFDAHLFDDLPECKAEPTQCLVCALATTRCPECYREADDIEADDPEHGDHGHVIMNGFVLVGCEGYLLPAARAAALIGGDEEEPEGPVSLLPERPPASEQELWLEARMTELEQRLDAVTRQRDYLLGNLMWLSAPGPLTEAAGTRQTLLAMAARGDEELGQMGLPVGYFRKLGRADV